MESAVEPARDRLPPVAVITVHGVGAPRLGQTAMQLADSLRALDDRGIDYSAFTSEPVCITTGAFAPRSQRRPRSTLTRHIVSALVATQLWSRRGQDNQPSPSFDQKACESRRPYPDRKHLWHTLRLASSRTDRQGDTGDVHIYEFNWADLRGPGTTFLHHLVRVGLLIVSVLTVGRACLADAGRERRRTLWHIWRWTHVAATQAIALIVPAATATYFLMLIAFTPLPAASWPHAATVAIASGCLLGWGFLTWRHIVWPRDRAIAALWIVVSALAVGIVLVGDHGSGSLAQVTNLFSTARLLVLLWLALTVGITDALFRGYARVQPGARLAFRTALAYGLVIFGQNFALGIHNANPVEIAMWRQHPADDLGIIFGISFASGDVATALALVWVVAALLGLLSGVFATGCVLTTRLRAARHRARRTAWTAHVTLGASVLAIQAVQYVAITLPSYDWFSKAFSVPIKAGEGFDVFGQIFLDLVALTSPVILVAVALALVSTLACAIAPPLLMAYKRREETDESSARGGAWLTRGMRAFRVTARITVGCAIPLTIGLSAAIMIASVSRLEDHVHAFVEQMTVGLGVLLLACALWRQLGRAIGLIIGLVSDVVLYVRETAPSQWQAIATDRFASLVQAISNVGRDGACMPYRGIVIVGHSQGTVIAADALRLMRTARGHSNERGGNESAEPSVALVTLGSPLLEWYARCLPQRFSWMGAPDTLGPPFENGDEPTPSPDTLGIRMWMNLYRSGDYIGRTLWPRWRSGREHTMAWWTQAGCFERCLGPGGHIEYWGAEDVALAVDRLLGLDGIR